LHKPSENCHWPNRGITFIVAKKSLITVYFALFMVYVGEGVG